MADLILLLNGFPGVGKLTIGRLVARSMELRLLDNHTLLNPAARSGCVHIHAQMR